MRRSPESGNIGGAIGKVYEGRVAGTFSPNDARAYRDAIEKEKARLAAGEGRFTREDGFRLVREHYGGDPTEPQKEIARDLRLEVIDVLELSEDESERLKFYTAVDTPLDEYHGVDAWIEYETPEGERVIVTLDITLNPEKLANGGKADVLIGHISSPQLNESEYLDEINEYAQKIVHVIRNRIALTPKSRMRRAS